jgi:hypothetical protein
MNVAYNNKRIKILHLNETNKNEARMEKYTKQKYTHFLKIILVAQTRKKFIFLIFFSASLGNP